MKTLLILFLVATPGFAQVPGVGSGPGDTAYLDPDNEPIFPKRDVGPPAEPGARPSSGREAPSAMPKVASAARTSGGVDGDWWQWWEFNKLAWLPPNRIGDGLAPVDARRTAEELHILRPRLQALLTADLEHSDPDVRSAALVALARAFGDAAFDGVERHFTDPHPAVRREAILALGAMRSERGVHRLLQTVGSRGTRGTRGPEGEDAITPRARRLAVLALGLARRRGVGKHTAAFLPAWNTDRGRNATDDLGNALLLHQALAPTPELQSVAREISRLFDDPRPGHRTDPLTARAVESLRFDGGPGVIPRLFEELDSRELDVRRSIALTLGASGDPAAVDPVLRAFASERELITRGFLILALGRLGGTASRDWLIEELRTGRRMSRPWALLALGILAREADDDVARTALREEIARERNRPGIGALLLAGGIARDPRAFPFEIEALRKSANGRTRMHAALALAMNRHAGALRDALPDESSSLVRITIAQGLGYIGDESDVPRMIEVLREVRHHDYQPQIASALGMHGTTAMLRALTYELEQGGLVPVSRAAALQAVGILLDVAEPFALTEICQAANFTVLPDWLIEPLLTTL